MKVSFMKKHEIKKSISDLLNLRKVISHEDLLAQFDKKDHDKVVRVLEDPTNAIVHDDVKGGYRFRHKFGSRPKEVHPSHPRFSTIPEHPIRDAAAYPDSYINPDLGNLAPLDQDQIGDCVGCSGASGSKLMRYRITKIPTPPEQLREIQRGIKNADGVMVDVLPDDTVSAAAVYCMSRARMTPLPANTDEGSQITDAADAITQDGVVPEWMWPTGKAEGGFYFAPPTEYADMEKQQAPFYRFGCQWSPLDGVAGDPTSQIMQAVTVYGGCWMAMPVFENYGQSSPSGDFPEPTPTSRIVGYHAIWIVGWTRDAQGNRRWQFVNSWAGFTPLVNTISDDYLQKYFKTGDLQLISVMPVRAIPFVARPLPSPAPAPAPAPVPTPNPVPTMDFWTALFNDIVAFFRALVGKKN